MNTASIRRRIAKLCFGPEGAWGSRNDKGIMETLLEAPSREVFSEGLSELSRCVHPSRVIDSQGWGLAHYVAHYEDESALLWRWPLLIEAGVPVNAPAGGAPEGDAGWYPLHLAVQGKSPAIVRLLLECGADVNCVDDGGNPALLFSTPATARVLLEAEASLIYRNDHGFTPLYELAYRAATNPAYWKEEECVEIMLLLLKAGANPAPNEAEAKERFSPKAEALLRAARHHQQLAQVAQASFGAPEAVVLSGSIPP